MGLLFKTTDEKLEMAIKALEYYAHLEEQSFKASWPVSRPKDAELAEQLTILLQSCGQTIGTLARETLKELTK